MASQNKLLGSGEVFNDGKSDHTHETGTRKLAWRYHETCREGRLLKTQEAIDEADANGWVDTPGKIFKLPGHERVYEDYQAYLKKKAEPPKPPELTPEQIEEARIADELKAANDAAEEKRLDDIKKALEPPERFICDICDKEFTGERAKQALRMHKMSAHKVK